MSMEKAHSDQQSSVEKGDIETTVVDTNAGLTRDDEIQAFARKDVSWTREEERDLVRRLDIRIMPLITILYLSNFIDRTNVGNAKVAGLEDDLHLVGFQYNIALSIFFIMYGLVEVPSNIFLKRVGAPAWIPTLVLFFGLVTTLTAVIKNFSGFMAIRVFLGLAEGGSMPGLAYYLSTWYRRDEVAARIQIFVAASSLAGAFGGLLASAFLSIKQLAGIPDGRWRNIFLIEGVITMGLAFLGYFILPRAPERNGILNEREKLIAMERIRADNAGLNEAENTDRRLSIRPFRSMNAWICTLGFFLTNITVQGVSLFMPTLLGGMGYEGNQLQLHTVPPYVVACAWSFLLAGLSQKTGRRGVFILTSATIAVIGSCMLIGSANRKVGYGGIFLLAMGMFPCGPLFLSWGTNNAAPYTSRAVTSAMIPSIGALGPIISAWAYLPDDGPRYIRGLSIQLGAQVLIIIITGFLVAWNMNENRARKQGKRDHRLENADEYTVSTLGSLHPKFRLTI